MLLVPPPSVSAAGTAVSAASSVVFLPAAPDEPPRAARFAFWGPLEPQDPADPWLHATEALQDAEPATVELALPDRTGAVACRKVPALLLPVSSALPVLTRLRAGERTHPTGLFWGAAALLALRFTAGGLLLPGVSADGRDAWRAGPLRAADVEKVRVLAAAMPPQAQSAPLSPSGSLPVLLPEAEALLRAFLDAVADTLPRSPAAPLVTGRPAYASPGIAPAGAAGAVEELRAWADEIAAGHDAGVRISLRVEAEGLDAAGAGAGAPSFSAVLQVHAVDDAALVADAARVWAGEVPALGARARTDALLALRRATAAWPALAPLLSAAVPDRLELADDEVGELLRTGARALASAGVDLHWPRGVSRDFTAEASIGPGQSPPRPTEDATGASPGSGPFGPGTPSLLSSAPLSFSWWFALGDQRISRAELDALAEAGRPLVRLRDRWVLVDPEEVRLARSRRDSEVSPLEALGAVLTGSTEVAGERVAVRPTGWLADVRDRLAAHADTGAVLPQPAALRATLRGYQTRGFTWLATMTSLGLGACLADDMGLGKTVTLIALHLHRQGQASTAGPTLVVCPASLMGNWQREIERFAPGTPVRRFHGPSRDLGFPEKAEDGGGFVLTTYGTMRLDAERLAAVDWGLVVADEAQHVKNPYASTARQLRTIGGRARVALTGTPVENNLSELWAVLDWTTPGILGRLGTFRARYARAVEAGTDPAAAERLGRLVRPFLLRRHKSDPGIAPELPAKTETDHTIALTAEQTGLYEAVVRQTLERIADAGGMERRGLVVGLLTSLKQICNHPAQYLKEKNPVLAGRSGKLELLDELLDAILAEGSGVLVFTQYVAMARLLERHLTARGVPSLFLHGGTPVAAREGMVRRFQESADGAVPVFLLSLKAAGTGLNLTRAAHVVHVDRWWNPAVEAQATDRAHRLGQTRAVQVHRLITEGTLEERIARMLERKQRVADAVLGSGEAGLTELTDAELADLVALRGGAR